LPDRTFDALSGSLGGLWSLSGRDVLAATYSRSERIPTANELFADGPHAATRAFEIGSPDLGVETAHGFDLSWRRTAGPVTGTLNVFFDRFDDFVFESFTGEEEDGLAVIRFLQADADFQGVEAEAAVDLYRGRESHLVLELSGDYVRAELRGSGEVDGQPLPRIPPLRLGAGLDYHRGPWRVFGEIRWSDMQDRVSRNETETDGYTLVNAAVSHRFLLNSTVLDVIVRGRNLTDEEARPHTSFLKDDVPLPGRDVSLALGLHF
jgi:iron complex outermembrane receptor protein